MRAIAETFITWTIAADAMNALGLEIGLALLIMVMLVIVHSR